MTIRNLVLAMCLACAPAWADDLAINLDTTQFTVSPGDSITFSGTITNNDSATEDLNNISISLPGMFSVDITPFFNTAPLTVAGNSSTTDIDFFTVTVDIPYTDPGIVSGTLTIQGGVEGPGGYDGSVQDDLGSTSFSLDVSNSFASTPEPSAIILALTMCALVLVSRARRAVNRRPGPQAARP
jgi:hypothetical protein